MKSNYQKPFLIAEIGCNHMGNLDLAKELIIEAKKCNADYAKFQKRDNKYLLKEDYDLPHPVPHNSFGKSYGEHREFLEFSIQNHIELNNFCKKNDIKYAVSVWEINSAKEIIENIEIDFIKVPSACNLDRELLEFLFDNFNNNIHISLGMTTKSEIKRIVDFSTLKGRSKDLVLYACESSYPSKFENLNLPAIKELNFEYSSIINSVGFSGHHLGISIDVIAFTLGAKYIERHFTLDRTFKGTDHAASLEPQGLSKLSRDLNNAYLALQSKNKASNDEENMRAKLKKTTTL
tara:strand:- start:87 stop:962 length:876 start_codon:yes stop_codon:yes gene_type:complete